MVPEKIKEIQRIPEASFGPFSLFNGKAKLNITITRKANIKVFPKNSRDLISILISFRSIDFVARKRELMSQPSHYK
jgi:hypothetical protein